MLELQRLRPDHAEAVLDFELANRAYFAELISDRGDDFFERFAERYRAFLAEQDAGRGFFHVLVADDGTIVGRFNLYDVDGASANVGYRVAQRFSGRGMATTGLQMLCRSAGAEYGLRTLRATTSDVNVASQRVLAKAGFVAVGATEIEGRHGVRYELELAGR